LKPLDYISMHKPLMMSKFLKSLCFLCGAKQSENFIYILFVVQIIVTQSIENILNGHSSSLLSAICAILHDYKCNSITNPIIKMIISAALAIFLVSLFCYALSFRGSKLGLINVIVFVGWFSPIMSVAIIDGGGLRFIIEYFAADNNSFTIFLLLRPCLWIINSIFFIYIARINYMENRN